MIPTDKCIEKAQRKENMWQCYNNENNQLLLGENKYQSALQGT